MSESEVKRGQRGITRSADVDAVVLIADLYADQACHLHEFVRGEELHKAMAGAFLMFLTDVAQSEG